MLIQEQYNNLIFNENLTRGEGATMFPIIEEVKETILDFPNGTVKVLWFYFVLI